MRHQNHVSTRILLVFGVEERRKSNSSESSKTDGLVHVKESKKVVLSGKKSKPGLRVRYTL